MKPEIQSKLALFADNTQIIKKQFMWHNTMTKRLAALLYADRGRSIDCNAIKDCHNMMKSGTGILSAFRGNMSLCIASLFSLSPNPALLFDETIKIYDLLKAEKFRASDYLVVSAYQIATLKEGKATNYIIKRMRAFYDGMKAYHRFNTGQDDYIFSAMLALSDLDVQTSTKRMEELFQRLKPTFRDNNNLQGLTQVLILGGESDNTADRIIALSSELKARKLRLNRSYTLPSLGVLALLPADTYDLGAALAEASGFLYQQKGFNSLFISQGEHLLYCAAVIASDYADQIKDGVLTATLSTSITNLLIAQETAMIAASSAAAASAAASSH
jgi:hypothetical protein